MCDTVVALGSVTRDGVTYFGKNSDRPPNEPQPIRYISAQTHEDDEELHCTYLSIPQVRHTHAVILSSPYWLWGAEMGANERGVVIGNEAVFSREDVPKTGLLGMDLVRLGLERGDSARNALEVIVDLLESYGQGGYSDVSGVMMYHNSFLIADDHEAFILETSQRRWVMQQVRDIGAISNGYTIHDVWDAASEDLVEHAIEQGWIRDDSDFDFAAVYGNEGMRYITRCDERLEYTRGALGGRLGEIDFSTMAEILRYHPPDWTPWRQDHASICQHAGPMNGFLTAGSQISRLGEGSVHYFTGCSNPCMNLYVPFTFAHPHVCSGMDVADRAPGPDSFWWTRERTSRDLSGKFTRVKAEYGALVARWQDKMDLAFSRLDWRAMDSVLEEFEQARTGLAGAYEPPPDVDPEYVAYWEDQRHDIELI
ncbi:MAG: C69 family dipeptidase [Candidatus Thorarchaeota archaeon]